MLQDCILRDPTNPVFLLLTVKLCINYLRQVWEETKGRDDEERRWRDEGLKGEKCDANYFSFVFYLFFSFPPSLFLSSFVTRRRR